MADGGSTLAVRQTVVDLVRCYQAAEEDIRRGFRVTQLALERIGDAFGDAPQIRGGRREAPLDFGDADAAIISIRRHCWKLLIAKLELSKVMSIKRWEELWRQVDQGPDKDVPEITEEYVLGMAENFRSQIPDMLRESVREVYDWLRPRNDDYKTNSEFGVGKRVILSWVIEQWRLPNWSVDYRYTQHLRAVERVFRMLDGHAPIAGDGNHYSEIETAMRAVPPGESCRGETTYFRFKGFKNRNLHLEIIREDLLARLNQVAGGGMLPTDASRRRKVPTPESILADAIERMRGEPGMKADFFATPAGLAADAVEWLNVANGMVVLEPSAGTGALVRAVANAAPDCAIDAVELDPERAAHLHALGARVIESDFLTMPPTPDFDRVVMNPPFSNHRDALHVAHAFRFLKPGGVLVAIMSAGTVFREDKVSRAFRELLAENEGEIRNNRDDAFKESGTMVRTVTVRMVRGEIAATKEGAAREV